MNPSTRFPGGHLQQHHGQHPQQIQFSAVVQGGQQPQQTGQHVHHPSAGQQQRSTGQGMIAHHQVPGPVTPQQQNMYMAALQQQVQQQQQQQQQQQHHQQQQTQHVSLGGQNPSVASFVPTAGGGGRGNIPQTNVAGSHAGHVHGPRHSVPQGILPPNSNAGGGGPTAVSNAANMPVHAPYPVMFNPGYPSHHHQMVNQQQHYMTQTNPPTMTVQAANISQISYGTPQFYMAHQFQAQGVRHQQPFAPHHAYQFYPNMAMMSGQVAPQQQMPPSQLQSQGPPRGGGHVPPSPSPSLASNPAVSVPQSAEGGKGGASGAAAPVIPPYEPRKKHVALIQDPNTLKEVPLEELAGKEPTSSAASSSTSSPAASVSKAAIASKDSEAPSTTSTATAAPAPDSKTSVNATENTVAVEFVSKVAALSKATPSSQPSTDKVDGEKQSKPSKQPSSSSPESKKDSKCLDSSVKPVESESKPDASQMTKPPSTEDTNKTSSSSIEKDLKTTAVPSNSEAVKEGSLKSPVVPEVKKVEEAAVKEPAKQPTPPTNTAQIKETKGEIVSKEQTPVVNNKGSAPKDATRLNGDVSAPIPSSEAKTQTAAVLQEKPVPPASDRTKSSPEPKAVDAAAEKVVPPLPSKDVRYVYNRSELVKLAESKLSKVKPEGLTDDTINMIRQGMGVGGGSKSIGAVDAFLPTFAGRPGQGMTGSSGASRSMRQSSSQIYSGRPSQDMRKPTKVIIPSPSLSQDVKLHTAENAWKPEVGVKKTVTEEETEEAVTKELLKKFRGYLNKITPQKYDVIEQKIRELKIDTEDRLKRVLDLVFDKAVDEPNFCIQYANLCKYLATIKINKKDEQTGQDTTVEFRRLLLTRCQTEFEKDVYEAIDIEGKLKAIEECKDPEKKKFLEAELDEDKRRARFKSLGNMKLVGELYRLHMLKGFIMLNCVHKLCNEIEDETLECLCILLRTIGQQLENEMSAKTKNPSDLENYFNRMKRIVAEKTPSVSSRVRFLLQDIIDMRDNGWQERNIHKDNKPKTIDQIHEEVAVQEQKNFEDHLKHQSQMKNDRRRGQDNYGSRKSQQGSMQSRGNQQEAVTGIITALKQMDIQGQQQDTSAVTLGPKNFGTWASGAAGSKQQTTSSVFPAVPSRGSQEGPSNMSRNTSSLGGNKDSGNRGASGGYSSGQMSRSQGPSSSYSSAHSAFIKSQPPKSSTPPFRDLNRSRNASLEKGGKNSAPNSRSSSQRVESPRGNSSSGGGRSPQTPIIANISEEDARKKVKDILDSLEEGEKIDELEKDIASNFNEQTIGMFFSNSIETSLDSSQETRRCVARIIGHLVCESCIGVTLDVFVNALDSTLEAEEDLIVDVPKFWQYLGETSSQLFLQLKDASERRTIITSALKKCIKTDKADKFIASLLKSAADFSSEGEAVSAWKSTGLSWTDVLSSDLDTFCNKYKDVSFIKSSSDSSRNSPVINLSDFKVNLDRLLQEGKSSDEVSSFVKTKIDETPSPDIISALTSSILESSIDESTKKLDETRLGSLCPVLLDVINEDAKRELCCLHAIQLKMEELQHPSGLSGKVLEILYDKEVLGHDTILNWEADKDKNTKGKALTVLNAKQFVDILKEDDDDEEDQTSDTNNKI